MKIVIAMDSFKGSLTALEAATAFGDGLKRTLPEAEIVKVPMADGGEGTVQSLVDATGGRIMRKWVTGPLGEAIEAFYGILGDNRTAVIEMAAASGLPLVPIEKRNPYYTTTYGTGELIKAALDQGCRSFYIGIGGSATNDGGAGMAQALGIKLLDSSGQELSPGGKALGRLCHIDLAQLDSRIKECSITVACDVDNPLCGKRGASHVYGPQKGATAEMVKELDKALLHFAAIVKKETGKDIADIKGAGAAGGLGGGLIAFLDASLQPGVDIVIEQTNLRNILKGADLVITGEGQIDGQTGFGKTPMGVTKAAKEFNIPVVAIAGSLGAGFEALYDHGIDGLFSIMLGPITLQEAMNSQKAKELIQTTASNIGRLFKNFAWLKAD